eukprot:8532610-Ditylum_brightwellii.AAC.1
MKSKNEWQKGQLDLCEKRSIFLGEQNRIQQERISELEMERDLVGMELLWSKEEVQALTSKIEDVEKKTCNEHVEATEETTQEMDASDKKEPQEDNTYNEKATPNQENETVSEKKMYIQSNEDATETQDKVVPEKCNLENCLDCAAAFHSIIISIDQKKEELDTVKFRCEEQEIEIQALKAEITLLQTHEPVGEDTVCMESPSNKYKTGHECTEHTFREKTSAIGHLV